MLPCPIGGCPAGLLLSLLLFQMWDEACDFEGELGHFRDNLTKFENATDGELHHILCTATCTYKVQ